MADPHGLLYHYTNSAGLIGILQSNALWATDSRFLNDSQEVVYALDVMSAALGELAHDAEADDQIRARVVELIRVELQNHSDLPPVYVACFCDDGDLLSQWRAYGPEQGYAIGFDPKQLTEVTVAEVTVGLNKPTLAPVVYGPEAAAAQAKAALAKIGHSGKAGHFGVAAWHEVGWYVLPELARMKHPGFAEEREWRLVFVDMHSLLEPGTRVRPSPMGIVPYLRLLLPPLAIRRVVVGPGGLAATRKEGVEELLKVNAPKDPNRCQVCGKAPIHHRSTAASPHEFTPARVTIEVAVSNSPLRTAP